MSKHYYSLAQKITHPHDNHMYYSVVKILIINQPREKRGLEREREREREREMERERQRERERERERV